jgi:hypothetical protein
MLLANLSAVTVWRATNTSARVVHSVNPPLLVANPSSQQRPEEIQPPLAVQILLDAGIAFIADNSTTCTARLHSHCSPARSGAAAASPFCVFPSGLAAGDGLVAATDEGTGEGGPNASHVSASEWHVASPSRTWLSSIGTAKGGELVGQVRIIRLTRLCNPIACIEY